MIGITISLERVYDLVKSQHKEGKRVLVDRIWPRGIKKEELDPFLWMNEIAPSEQLRKWFNHDESKFEEFRIRYIKELGYNPEITKLKAMSIREDVVLLYGARDRIQNNAVVLKEYIEQMD